MAIDIQRIIDSVLRAYREINDPDSEINSKKRALQGIEAHEKNQREILARRQLISGELDKQRLINEGGIEKQSLVNRGNIDVEGLRNKGSLDVKEAENVGALARQRLMSDTELKKVQVTGEYGLRGNESMAGAHKYAADRSLEGTKYAADTPKEGMNEIIMKAYAGSDMADPESILALKRRLLAPAPSAEDKKNYYTPGDTSVAPPTKNQTNNRTRRAMEFPVLTSPMRVESSPKPYTTEDALYYGAKKKRSRVFNPKEGFFSW